MQPRPLLPGEYAILCLLTLRPMHGYEMVCLLAAEGLDAICPVEQSTLYTYLRTLESRGLVSWSEERVGSRPPRKVFELSEPGRNLVEEWLRRPVERIREVRLEFLLKVFFLGAIDRMALRELLAQQIEVCEEYIEDCRSNIAGSPFRRLVALSKSSAAESTLAWLKSYAYEVEQEVTHD